MTLCGAFHTSGRAGDGKNPRVCTKGTSRGGAGDGAAESGSSKPGQLAARCPM